MINQQRLLERFLRYVRIDTTARDGATSYPSSPGQLELGRMLADELRSLGLADVEHDAHGIVMATLPSTVDAAAPVVALCAHVDTSPETTGAGVRPQVIAEYDGRDITLPGDASKVIRVTENPELADLAGKTLITTDGTTLLGADDKAGIAVIMETAAYLVEHPQSPHGAVRICFTCDEEIGHGVDHVDLARLGACVCYTLDGQGVDEIDVETFSADLAEVTIEGVNIHPSIAKGRMVNAVRAAACFLEQLPRQHSSPETTDDRQGFLHPYRLEASVERASLRVLLRDFDAAELRSYANVLEEAAQTCRREFPGAIVTVRITPQYRNLAVGLAAEPRAVALAEEAFRRLGRTPKRTIVRGGTDGSRLTELGLPTPNLSTGEHNPHSPLEWTCLEEMGQAVQMLVELVALWSQEPG